MYSWVSLIHGDQTGYIIGAILEHCDIDDIRMMLKDFSLLILRAG